MLGHMDIAHNAAVEKRVSEMERNRKLKTLEILKDHYKENHLEIITNFSVINFKSLRVAIMLSFIL